MMQGRHAKEPARARAAKAHRFREARQRAAIWYMESRESLIPKRLAMLQKMTEAVDVKFQENTRLSKSFLKRHSAKNFTQEELEVQFIRLRNTDRALLEQIRSLNREVAKIDKLVKQHKVSGIKDNWWGDIEKWLEKIKSNLANDTKMLRKGIVQANKHLRDFNTF